MREKERLVFTFFIFLSLSIIILALSLFGKLAEPQSFLEKGVSFLPKITYGLFQGLPLVSETKQIKKLKEENLALVSKLVDQDKLQKENAALLSQFQTPEPKSFDLLPAKVVGAPGFIPGIITPANLILDKGEKDNVRLGDGVVLKSNLIGRVNEVSSYLSKVDLVVNPLVTLSVKTINGATGIVRGAGGDKMTLDNVSASEILETEDFVLTNGNIDIDGTGIPPDLIVGKIRSIEKIPTAVFQRAQVESLINFTKLSTVFIIKRI
jgi:cell shape-determining protein MreC